MQATHVHHRSTSPRGLALLLALSIGCDVDEGRDAARPPLGLTTAAQSSTSSGEVDDSTSTSSDASSSTTGTSSTTSTTTGSETSSSTGDTTGDDTTSGTTETTGEGPSTTGDDSTSTTSTSTVDDSTSTTGDDLCPCTAEVVEGENLCAQDPTPECPATMPGGLCDPDGDGSYADGDWVAGYFGYLSACS